MEAGLDSVKFSEGIKSPPGDHTAAEREIMSSKQAVVERSLKTGIFLTLKRNGTRTTLVLENPGSCTSTIAANIKIQPRARDRRAPDEGKSNRRERKNGFQAHQQRSHGGI